MTTLLVSNLRQVELCMQNKWAYSHQMKRVKSCTQNYNSVLLVNPEVSQADWREIIGQWRKVVSSLLKSTQTKYKEATISSRTVSTFPPVGFGPVFGSGVDGFNWRTQTRSWIAERLLPSLALKTRGHKNCCCCPHAATAGVPVETSKFIHRIWAVCLWTISFAK